MSLQLPESMLVLERGWLSANNVLFFEGDTATLIDSGYVSHAEQTVALVEHALDGRWRVARRSPHLRPGMGRVWHSPPQ